jgi:branched-chain amino acid transport system substrate-binding protein
MAQAYAGGLVAQRCVEAAGTLAQHALRQAAYRLDFTTFYGRYRVDPSSGRQIGHHMPVVQWQGQHKVILWPPHSPLG